MLIITIETTIETISGLNKLSREIGRIIAYAACL